MYHGTQMLKIIWLHLMTALHQDMLKRDFKIRQINTEKVFSSVYLCFMSLNNVSSIAVQKRCKPFFMIYTSLSF